MEILDITPPAPKEVWLRELVERWESEFDILDWLKKISAEMSSYFNVSEPNIFSATRVHRRRFGKFNILYDWREKRILVHRNILKKFLENAYRVRSSYELLSGEVKSFLDAFFMHYEFYIEHARRGDRIVEEWLRETETPYHERESTIRAAKFGIEMSDRYITHAWRYKDWYKKRVKMKITI